MINTLVPGACNVEVTSDQGTPILEILYKDHSVPLTLSGDGIKTLVRLILELISCPNGVVLVEEPELHQHPAALLQSAKAIWAAIRRNIQVILTTHSLELIDALMSEPKDDTELEKLTVYRLRLDEGCLKSSHTEGGDVAFLRGTFGDDLR